MKMHFIVRSRNGLVILAVLAGTGRGVAQTWIQWTAAVGGNRHYYALTPVATNWTAAAGVAEAWGGTLATITSSNEQGFINATFLKGAFEHRPVWIGLIDRGANSLPRKLEKEVGFIPKYAFRWVTGEAVEYSNWASGQPDDFGGEEFCVTINWHNSDKPPRGTKGDWNDAPVDGTRGFGGTTDGPYFGLMERETDPSLRVRRRYGYGASFLMIVGVGMVLWVLGVRVKGRRKAR